MATRNARKAFTFAPSKQVQAILADIVKEGKATFNTQTRNGFLNALLLEFAVQQKLVARPKVPRLSKRSGSGRKRTHKED